MICFCQLTSFVLLLGKCSSLTCWFEYFVNMFTKTLWAVFTAWLKYFKLVWAHEQNTLGKKLICAEQKEKFCLLASEERAKNTPAAQVRQRTGAEGLRPYLGHVMHTKIGNLCRWVCCFKVAGSTTTNILRKRSLKIECLYPYECFHMQINSAKRRRRH